MPAAAKGRVPAFAACVLFGSALTRWLERVGSRGALRQQEDACYTATRSAAESIWLPAG